MYLLKCKDFANIWWRIENRVHELADTLDAYQITNILRSFSRSQENRMSGSDKLFIHLEGSIMRQIDKFSLRDLSHLMYAYSIRAAGNPEIYKTFESKLLQHIEQKEKFDYPIMHNLLYFLMFRESKNETIWKYVIDQTIEQDDILPIVNYKPFKFSKFYLLNNFPNWDISEYVNRFWYSE